MSTIALLVLGIFASLFLPVSLLPDVDIPVLSVKIEYRNTSARELENTIVKPIREQLLQLNNITDICSETRNETAIIELKFKYKTNINYAYIEANEKIDDILGSLPRDMQRPKLIKASASDIPVFYLNIFGDSLYSQQHENLLGLSEFCEMVVKKRIEQLPEVALADLSGLEYPQLVVLPDREKMSGLGISYHDIEKAFNDNNLSPGNLLIKTGMYQYHLRFSNQLRSVEDIGSIYLKAGNKKIIRLSEIATISVLPQKRNGLYLYNDHDAVCLAVIKQADARMSELHDNLAEVIEHFRELYPHLDFEISRDQTRLLNYSINNLKQSLLLAIVLSFLIMLLFMRDIKSPIIIGISIPVSLVVSVLLFHIFGLSINIISLTGLILGVGMMVDNSIIVIDNIAQLRRSGNDTANACIKGTNEVIRPLISSVLTTCAVFIPLVFLSDISGALFYDQAVAVCITLGVSFFVSVMLLPVLYRLFFGRSTAIKEESAFVKWTERVYERGLQLVFRHKLISLFIFLMLIPLGYMLFICVEKQGFPELQQTESLLSIDWNENIHTEENKARVLNLLSHCDALQQSNSMIGTQQFILNNNEQRSPSEALIYLQSASPFSLRSVMDDIALFMDEFHADASYSFAQPENPFQQMFDDEKAPLVAEVFSANSDLPLLPADIERINYCVRNVDAGMAKVITPIQHNIELEVLLDKLLLYDVDYGALIRVLKSEFRANEAGSLFSGNSFIPVMIGEENPMLFEAIQKRMVISNKGKEIPVSSLVKVNNSTAFKVLKANRRGEYIPVYYSEIPEDISSFSNDLEAILASEDMKVRFSGSYFQNIALLKQLGLILLISILMLYFILAAQFESLLQPIIVLLEVFFDMAGSLFMLLLFGSSLNIMSAIGIIVMSGIIINDSILKIDTINRIYRETGQLHESIFKGGIRRLKPIIMTSLTTILALLPLLFFGGLGAELQKPLALAIIGGMLIGTLVSLYFIPLAYWFINRKKGRN